MHLRKLQVKQFRNYEAAEAPFVEGFNLIVGRNAQGKTNLLEAVYAAAYGGSWRSGGTAAMVRHGAEEGFVAVHATVQGREITVRLQVSRSEGMRANVGEGKGRQDSSLAAVIFTPDDLLLVKGSPDLRREFIDRIAGRGWVRATSVRREFDRILRQRTGAVRAAGAGSKRAGETIPVWDAQLARAGASLVSLRLRAIEALERRAYDHYRYLSGENGMRITYVASWMKDVPEGSEDHLATVLGRDLELSRRTDIERGQTLRGPHRDDLALTLNGRAARSFVSQGEQRTLALALRLAEWDALTAWKGEPPLLLLDDVFSELDETRRRTLLELCASAQQTIATATGVPGTLLAPGQVLDCTAGKVSVKT